VDESSFAISGTKVVAGRYFSPYELSTGADVCVLGHGIATKLFKTRWETSLGTIVSAEGHKLRILGVTESQSGNPFLNADNTLYIPLTLARNMYGNNQSFRVSVAAAHVNQKSLAADESEGLMRTVRKVPLGTASDFSIIQDDPLADTLFDLIRYVRIAAVFIGIITLIGSVIGLMNIMLVSVAERTREIGVNKALGARPATIRAQFLTESVLISLLGGAVGVALGTLIGLGVAALLHGPFSMPWLWIISGFSLCAFVGILSGIYPALKASRLDPIIALRYE
jgi:putative ABC transport system permease protein